MQQLQLLGLGTVVVTGGSVWASSLADCGLEPSQTKARHQQLLGDVVVADGSCQKASSRAVVLETVQSCVTSPICFYWSCLSLQTESQ